MSKSRWFLLVLVVALAAAGALWMAQARRVAAIPAQRMDLLQTVVASARVMMPARAEIGSVLLGTLATLRAREGDKVRQGQVLALLRDDELRAALVQARGALAEAEARVAQLKSVGAPVAEQGLKQAETNLALAQKEHERVRQLYRSGFYSKSRLDESERNVELSRSAVASALAQAESNRPRGSDTALALSRLDQARAAVKVAEARLDHSVIRAPAAGVILQRFAEPGDVVTQGKRLFTLSVTGQTQIVANVEEKNLGLIALGQKAQASADAYPGQRFGAEIFYVAPSVDAQRGTVEVKLAVHNPPPYLRPDMTVSVEIAVARSAGAVVLPSDALREAASASPWVLVAPDGRAQRRAIKLGLHGDGMTEVLEGVQPGELVIPPSQAGVAEGTRVNVYEAAARAPRPVLKAQEVFR